MSDYDVVLLVEQALTPQDAAQVRSLHEEIEDPVRYHVLLPVEDSATQIESGMGALAGGEVLATPTMFMDPEDVDEIRHELLDAAREAVKRAVAEPRGRGRHGRRRRRSASTRSRLWPRRSPRSTPARRSS